MLIILLYVFASFGAAFALGYSKISLPLRKRLDIIGNSPVDWENVRGLEKIPSDLPKNQIVDTADRVLEIFLRCPSRWLLSLLECPACVSFWFGVAASFTPIVDAIPVSAPFPFILPLLGFANMGAVLSLGMLTGLIKTE